MDRQTTKTLLRQIYEAAVAAAHPATCLIPALPKPPARGQIIVLAAGKAAGSMAEATETHYLGMGFCPGKLSGIAITRHGYGRLTQRIEMIEAGHPVPDEAGLRATERVLTLADNSNYDDLVLVLLSGGASANWIAPACGISLDEKRVLTRNLLASGATIGEINTVRKHISRIKGGRLAVRAAHAEMITLAISDVPGDDPSIIGSGPTVPDPSTLLEAQAILLRRNIDPARSIVRALCNPKNESPKPGDHIFDRTKYGIISRPIDALAAAANVARTAGMIPIVLGDRVEGEAREVATAHAEEAIKLIGKGKRSVLLSGGELTVTLHGKGRGGPNQEYILALALALQGVKGIAAIAGDTDGTDGGAGRANDPAGAFMDETTLARARDLGLDPARFLADNDSSGFFERLDDLLSPGPTYTNVNDLRAIVVDT